MTPKQKTKVLGAEYDEAVRRALKEVLVKLKATGGVAEWGVGGSQELETMEVLVEGNVITVESETYVGLTITGEESMVERIAALVEAYARRM